MTKNKRDQRATSSLPQAGAQLVPMAVRNSNFWLSSEPFRSPRLRQAATTLAATRTAQQGMTTERRRGKTCEAVRAGKN